MSGSINLTELSLVAANPRTAEAKALIVALLQGNIEYLSHHFSNQCPEENLLASIDIFL